jgi:serine/threonine-protein kinase HipA
MPKVPIVSTGPKRMSLAGAQHKLVASWSGAQLSAPQGMTPTTHILEPPHWSADCPDSVINEFAMMKLAARMGLNAPGAWRHDRPQRVCIVDRLDRST